MPIALYVAWAWGVPECDWKELAALPDTARWIAWELDVCARVDRIIVPCQEAVAELARVDARFARLTPDLIETGAAGPTRRFPGESRARLRERFGLPDNEPVGLFLGSAQPYRGFEQLCAAAAALPPNVSGVMAVAGPSRTRVPNHRRLRALGPVSAVRDLLDAVDFVVNANVFSLFDLSTIEAAEAGCPMLLHATGGNLRFERIGVGCRMMRDLESDTIANGLAEMFGMTDADRRALGDSSRACYERRLTPAHLWANHAAVYNRVQTNPPLVGAVR
jgi:glycosyltransferase involved in cell wall biosynthesis